MARDFIAVDVPQGTCTTCGVGTRLTEGPFCGRCSYCHADFAEGEHVHKMGIKANGLSKCVGHRELGCTYEEYDAQWGAGLFTDWPAGHFKPYGA